MYPAFHIPALMVSTMLFASVATAPAVPPLLRAAESTRAAATPNPALPEKAPAAPLKFDGKSDLFSRLPGLESYLDMKERALASVGGEEAGAPAAFDPRLPGQPAKERYPWRNNIVTTTFWIGEEAAKNNPVANHKSSWDQQWAKNYGGYDDPNPKNRSQYLPAKFTPRQNPFYIALPYNDTTRGKTKPEASKVIPWFEEAFERPGRTVLKGRWVAVRFKDRIAYAQWEDVGPFRTDHWQYVFGNERPKPNLNKGAGLDVSPAVRDYLGMRSTDVTDWRFVDFDEVPSGPWATHGDNNTFVQNARARDRQNALADNEDRSSSRTSQ